MSSKKPIFSDPKNGGRKANLLASMVKKTQNHLLNLEKNQPSPFSAYSFSSNQLAQSQVTTGFNASLVSVESIKITVHDQVEKYLEKTLNQRLTKMFSQRDKQERLFNQTVTQDIQKLNKSLESVIKNYDQKNKELFNTFQNARIQHDQMTLNNLKIFIGLMKEQLTKDFVPMKLLEELDLDKLLQSFEDRIQALEQKPMNISVRKSTGEDTVLSKEVQLNVNKTMREIETIKKSIAMLTEEKNLIRSDMLGINKSIVDITMRNDQHASKIDVVAKQANEELTSQLAKLREQIQDNTLKLNKNIEDIKTAPLIMTLSKLKSTQSNQQKLQNFKLQDQSITNSMTLPSNYHPFSPDRDNQIKPTSPKPPLAPNTSEQPAQNLYQIDSEGLLMDEHGQYILDTQGNFIMLSQQQINALKQSNMLIQ